MRSLQETTHKSNLLPISSKNLFRLGPVPENLLHLLGKPLCDLATGGIERSRLLRKVRTGPLLDLWGLESSSEFQTQAERGRLNHTMITRVLLLSVHPTLTRSPLLHATLVVPLDEKLKMIFLKLGLTAFGV